MYQCGTIDHPIKEYKNALKQIERYEKRLVEEIYKHIKKNKNIYIVAADISPSGKMAEISEKNDKQIINVGVAEQVMVGVAAGLSMEKNKVFCYTIAPFSLYRPFEFVRDDLCFAEASCNYCRYSAGTIYSELGPTHTAIEDISIARSLL